MCAEGRAFPWKPALLRMFADTVLVNASIVAAFLLRLFVQVIILGRPQAEGTAQEFRNFIHVYWFFWTLLALLVFHLSGFYTRARGYAGRYKAWVVFRAVTLFVVVFVFTDYFLFRGSLMPRGVAVVSWALLLAGVGGSRLFKASFLRRYRIQVKGPSAKVERVLVVGGAGYVGSILVPQLLERGYKVRVLEKFLFGEASLQAVRNHPGFEVVKGDVRDIEAAVDATKDCDAVIDLAAIVGDPACEENRPLAVEVNRAATRMLIDVAKGYGVSRFLFASTCSVYGASDFLVDERSGTAALSTYAQTKVDSENLLLEAVSPSFHPTVLRLGTLFGLSPRPRFDLLVNLLTARAATLGTITIFNGDQWRPFMHVRDAARAFVKALEANPAVVSGEVFNVGAYDLNYKLTEVSEKIARLVPRVEVQHVENGDRRNYRASFDKIHTRLGFTCQQTLEDGILEIYSAIKSQRIADFRATSFNNQAAIREFSLTAGAGLSSLGKLRLLAQCDDGKPAVVSRMAPRPPSFAHERRRLTRVGD